MIYARETHMLYWSRYASVDYMSISIHNVYMYIYIYIYILYYIILLCICIYIYKYAYIVHIPLFGHNFREKSAALSCLP